MQPEVISFHLSFKCSVTSCKVSPEYFVAYILCSPYNDVTDSHAFRWSLSVYYQYNMSFSGGGGGWAISFSKSELII